MIAAITNSKQLTQQQQQQQLRLLSSQGAYWIESVVVGLVPTLDEMILILAMAILFLLLSFVPLTQSLTQQLTLPYIVCYDNPLFSIEFYYFINTYYQLILYACHHCCFIWGLRFLSYLLRLWDSIPSKSTTTKSTTKARVQGVVVETVSDEDAVSDEKTQPPPAPPAAAPQAPYSPPQHVYDEAWSIRVDGLFFKIDRVEEDLVMVERAIRTASTQCRLWGATWNFQDQMHINNVITSLLCHLDAIDIPQQAVFLRSQRKQFVRRIEGLIDLRKASMSSKKRKKSTTTRRVVSSSSTSSTPTKKEKLLAAKARARQWSDKTFKNILWFLQKEGAERNPSSNSRIHKLREISRRERPVFMFEIEE
ncbi:hypothetical protein FRACYDRAFT_244177 [Fragilariopsis cylindrus CCMP1102]|uniref:Uncharacterized protein n=1 Tax=Fragilariopsis cylindrus CCMP1102 TaxID=635003 RepID=A0A1E7F448_9STRA|nr:hypothetical protein FRACYDRAFT_244177 [Fragilariopsis cylindrus CCMP1102]|eukprot:OEU12904.1 hypothetical protein FRACYDRAFT_244177 [Fragilariopsis cylindrus CCMP1102]